MAYTFQGAQDALNDLSSSFIVKTYVPGGKQSTFVYLPENREFAYQFGSLLFKLKKNPTYVPGAQRHTKETAEARLAEVTTRYTLEEFNPGKKALSIFKDTSTGELREAQYNNTIQGLKRNPDFIIAATPEEMSALRHAAAFVNPLTPGQIVARQKKVAATRKKTGLTISVHTGETYPEIASRLNLSYSLVQSAFKHGASSAKVLSDLESLDTHTSIELPVSELLDTLTVEVVKNRKLLHTKYRPDFYLPSKSIVIECDGLYWHSDKYKDRSYHKKKKEDYDKIGIRSLFFRGDELRSKAHICKSIIRNALHEPTVRVFARKTEIQEMTSNDFFAPAQAFFTTNHLMGKGSGRVYGLCYKGHCVAAIQVRWVKKKERVLDISRFCTALNTSVVGGWSKLIKHVIKTEKPKTVQTFIDLRYGTGVHLVSQGWVQKTNHVSFQWTDFKQTCHRMKYPKNTGYENGLSKIWDCGQAKFVLDCT